MYFVAGALVACHFEAVFTFVRRWSRWILSGSAFVAVGTMLWYAIVIAAGCDDRVGLGHLRADCGGMVVCGDRRTLSPLSVRWWLKCPEVLDGAHRGR